MMNIQYPTLNKNELPQFILHIMILRQNHFSLNPAVGGAPSSPEAYSGAVAGVSAHQP
ncbi:MAG: hypothetical protein NTV22_04450 [bacterium]|nr:hypothetical protein [bacterium]